MTLFDSPPTRMRQPNSKGVQNDTECVCLGHHIIQSLNVRQEVDQRMQRTMKTWLKLKPVWTGANCTTRRTLIVRVFHAIIQDKLIYGQETLHLKQAILKKIDAFRLCGLRSMLGLETTFL